MLCYKAESLKILFIYLKEGSFHGDSVRGLLFQKQTTAEGLEIKKWCLQKLSRSQIIPFAKLL